MFHPCSLLVKWRAVARRQNDYVCILQLRDMFVNSNCSPVQRNMCVGGRGGVCVFFSHPNGYKLQVQLTVMVPICHWWCLFRYAFFAPPVALPSRTRVESYKFHLNYTGINIFFPSVIGKSITTSSQRLFSRKRKHNIQGNRIACYRWITKIEALFALLRQINFLTACYNGRMYSHWHFVSQFFLLFNGFQQINAENVRFQWRWIGNISY